MIYALGQNTSDVYKDQLIGQVKEVQTLLISGFIDGKFTSGICLNDVEVAKRFGVSCTLF
jgi:hypothetical protein